MLSHIGIQYSNVIKPLVCLHIPWYHYLLSCSYVNIDVIISSVVVFVVTFLLYSVAVVIALLLYLHYLKKKTKQPDNDGDATNKCKNSETNHKNTMEEGKFEIIDNDRYIFI